MALTAKGVASIPDSAKHIEEQIGYTDVYFFCANTQNCKETPLVFKIWGFPALRFRRGGGSQPRTFLVRGGMPPESWNNIGSLTSGHWSYISRGTRSVVRKGMPEPPCPGTRKSSLKLPLKDKMTFKVVNSWSAGQVAAIN